MYYNDGSIYKGELKERYKHGKGIYIYNDSWIYMGEFLNDKKHGEGKEEKLKGDYYEYYIGTWKDDMKNGIGK